MKHTSHIIKSNNCTDGPTSSVLCPSVPVRQYLSRQYSRSDELTSQFRFTDKLMSQLHSDVELMRHDLHDDFLTNLLRSIEILLKRIRHTLSSTRIARLSVVHFSSLLFGSLGRRDCALLDSLPTDRSSILGSWVSTTAVHLNSPLSLIDSSSICLP